MKPGEHKTVQARFLEYAEAIGWAFAPRKEAEQRRGFDPEVSPRDRAKAHCSPLTTEITRLNLRNNSYCAQ